MCASLWAGEEVDSFCFISILNHGISHQGRMIHSRILANGPGIGEVLLLTKMLQGNKDRDKERSWHPGPSHPAVSATSVTV